MDGRTHWYGYPLCHEECGRERALNAYSGGTHACAGPGCRGEEHRMEKPTNPNMGEELAKFTTLTETGPKMTIPEYHKWLTKDNDERKMRTFDTGATRNTDETKIDPEGFYSPLVVAEFCEYMAKNRIQADGGIRASDNWQKGIPRSAYMKSLWRHFLELWKEHRHEDRFTRMEDEKIEALCALIFNAQGYLHEVLLGRDVGTQNEKIEAWEKVIEIGKKIDMEMAVKPFVPFEYCGYPECDSQVHRLPNLEERRRHDGMTSPGRWAHTYQPCTTIKPVVFPTDAKGIYK